MFKFYFANSMLASVLHFVCIICIYLFLKCIAGIRNYDILKCGNSNKLNCWYQEYWHRSFLCPHASSLLVPGVLAPISSVTTCLFSVGTRITGTDLFCAYMPLLCWYQEYWYRSLLCPHASSLLVPGVLVPISSVPTCLFSVGTRSTGTDLICAHTRLHCFLILLSPVNYVTSLPLLEVLDGNV